MSSPPLTVDDPLGDDEWVRRLEVMMGGQMANGHTIERLRNGDQIFPAMLREMQAASRSIDLLTFVYWTGQPARMIGETLLSKARDGVRVRVVLDYFGARSMDSRLLDQLEDAGVLVHWFRPVELDVEAATAIGNRTHRKICVVDEVVAFVGGVGIAQEWDGDARGPEEWRDTHFRVTGPAVDAIRSGFIDDWASSDHPLSSAHDEFPPQDDSGSVRALAVLGESEVEASATMLLKRVLIEGARQRIRLTTAYFSPNEAMADWLVQAARRGVDVQVMLPGSEIDKRLPQANGERAYPELLEAGVAIWSYEHTMLHAKVLTIDGLMADVGSSNYNDRSVRHDEEIDLVALDRDLVATLDQDFEADLVRCIPVDEQWWADRGVVERLQSAASGLVDRFV